MALKKNKKTLGSSCSEHNLFLNVDKSVLRPCNREVDVMLCFGGGWGATGADCKSSRNLPGFTSEDDERGKTIRTFEIRRNSDIRGATNWFLISMATAAQSPLNWSLEPRQNKQKQKKLKGILLWGWTGLMKSPFTSMRKGYLRWECCVRGHGTKSTCILRHCCTEAWNRLWGVNIFDWQIHPNIFGNTTAVLPRLRNILLWDRGTRVRLPECLSSSRNDNNPSRDPLATSQDVLGFLLSFRELLREKKTITIGWMRLLNYGQMAAPQ